MTVTGQSQRGGDINGLFSLVAKPHDFCGCYGGCYGGRIHRTGRGPVLSDSATGETTGQDRQPNRIGEIRGE